MTQCQCRNREKDPFNDRDCLNKELLKTIMELPKLKNKYNSQRIETSDTQLIVSHFRVFKYCLK